MVCVCVEVFIVYKEEEEEEKHFESLLLVCRRITSRHLYVYNICECVCDANICDFLLVYTNNNNNNGKNNMKSRRRTTQKGCVPLAQGIS